jgi:hypothetical protein
MRRTLYHTAMARVDNAVSQTYFALCCGGVYPPDTYCDPQSTCSTLARQIVQILQNKTPGTRRKEILDLLDYGELLTQYGCHALALIALQEARRQMLAMRATDDQHARLEELQVHLRQTYQPQPTKELTEPLSVTVPYFTGRGMQYLQALREHQANSARFIPSAMQPL